MRLVCNETKLVQVIALLAARWTNERSECQDFKDLSRINQPVVTPNLYQGSTWINQDISSWSQQKLGPLAFFRAKFWNCCVSSWCACTKMSQLLRCTLKRAAQRSGRADATVSKVCPIFCSHTGHWFSGEILLGIRNSCNSKDLSCCSRGFTSRTGRAGAEVSTVNVIWKNNLPIEVLKTQPQQPQQQQQQQNIKYSAISFLFLSTTYCSALQSTTK